MKKESTLTTFDLMDIWHIFIWHLIPIFAAAALAIAGLYVYAKFFKVTKYKSTATVYILKQEREGDSSYTQSDFTLALNVVNDCVYMIRSYEVLDDVIEELGLDMTASELSKCITTRNPDGTRILEVSVETPSAEQSKRIVDSVCRIGAEKISATMSMDQVNIYSLGKVPDKPSNSIGLFKYSLAGVIAAFIAFFGYFIAFLCDDKVKTEEDVAKYLNLSVLGIIPNAEDASGKKYKKYKYSRYKAYGRYQPYKYGSYGNTAPSAAAEDKANEERGRSDE